MSDMPSTLKALTDKIWRSGWIGAAVVSAVGLCLLHPALPVLQMLSYDGLSLLTPGTRPEEAVIVYMDEESYEKLRQPIHGVWDRRLHAQLIRELIKAEVQVMAFDVLFDRPNPAQDADLSAALKENGDKVVLASALEITTVGVAHVSRPLLPSPSLGTNIVHGIVNHAPETFGIIRRQMAFPHPLHTSFAARLFQLSGADINKPPETAWLQYYAAGAIPAVSYYAVLSNAVPAHRLAGKAVFIGRGNLITAEGPLQTDFHRTPSFWLNGRAIAGVELQATAFLNLLRGEWWTALSVGAQVVLVLLSGIFLGRRFARKGFRRSLVLALISAIGVWTAAMMSVWFAHLWIPWLVMIAQIPLALAFAAIAPERHRYDVFISYRRKDVGHALWIRAELARNGLRAYLDVSELEPGGVFRPELRNVIAETPIFLILIGPESLDRCWLEEDVMTQEIVHAGEHHKRIVPVLLDGSAWNSLPLWSAPVSVSNEEACRKHLPQRVVQLKDLDSVEYALRLPDQTILRVVNAIKNVALGKAGT